MKKIFKRVLATGLALSMVGLTACGQKDTGENCLDVYCIEAGYGVEWCRELLELFKQQDWVKEKYPNLQTSFVSNDQHNFAVSKMKAGEKNNTFDLLFGEFFQAENFDTRIMENLTDSVYRQKVPGEDVTYEEKCYASYNEANKYEVDANGKNVYYYTSWAGGTNGIFYNEDILNSLGLSVPRTTKELEETCQAILALKGNGDGKYDLGYSFIDHKGFPYLSYLFPIWWAQYQGIDGYTDFYNGMDDGAYSTNIFNQKGRLYALQTYERLFFYDDNNAYLDPSSATYQTAMTAQSNFLKGYGVFTANGDWFDNEVAERKAEIKRDEGTDYTIKLMRTPIISELGAKLGIYEEELRSAIDYVDGVTDVKPTFTSGDQDAIITAVSNARGIMGSQGPVHNAVVPSYAREKEIAKDFLRFMATDVALKKYIEVTKGSSLPFNYNVLEKSPELYESLTPSQQGRQDYLNSERINVQTLPDKCGFPLVKYGGLSEFSTSNYYAVFCSSENTLTAQNIYDKTKETWNQKKFDDACAKAGLI